MEEIRKSIIGYEGLYEVSNYGNVKRLARNTMSKYSYKWLNEIIFIPQPARGGYLQLSLTRDGINKTYLIHKLVMLSFVGVCPERHQINHLDGNPQNNSLSNLEYCSASHNILHSYYKLGRNAPYKGKFGKQHNTSKKILGVDIYGNTIGPFYGAEEAKRVTGINNKNIHEVLHQRRNTAGGYKRIYV